MCRGSRDADAGARESEPGREFCSCCVLGRRKLVLARVRRVWTRLQWIWADGGYAGQLQAWAWQCGAWVLAIVKRNETVKGWQLLPHRWIVERTFGWLGRYRRLSKDYEGCPQTGEAFIYVAMTHLMLRRLKPA